MSMNDVYWNSVLQQEGIPEAHLPTTTFEQICTLVASNLTVPTKKSTEIRPDKVILEPSVRLAATRKIGKQLITFLEDAGACTARLEGVLEQIESAIYSQSGDENDYYRNLTIAVDSLLFRAPRVGEPASKKDDCTPLLSSPTKEEARREDVLGVLQSYKQPFQALINDVENQMHELQGLRRPWTNEEKELPKVFEHMNAVYKLLLSMLGTCCSAEVGGVTTEVLVSIEKQIDYWLSLRKKFPIPAPPKPIVNKVSCQASLQGKIPAKSMNPRSPATCVLPRNETSKPSGTLPSLFYNPLNPLPTCVNGSQQRRIPEPPFGGFKLPPFNPQKSLPLKGSQPLLPSVEGAAAHSRFFTPLPGAGARTITTTTFSDDEKTYELNCISNLSSLQTQPERRKAGSAEASPRASLRRSSSSKGRVSARNRSTPAFPLADDLMAKSSNEHAFILSKLAEVISLQSMGNTNHHNNRQHDRVSRRVKRRLPQREEDDCEDDEFDIDEEDEEALHERRAKRSRTRSYHEQFEMPMRKVLVA